VFVLSRYEERLIWISDPTPVHWQVTDEILYQEHKRMLNLLMAGPTKRKFAWNGIKMFQGWAQWAGDHIIDGL